MSGTLNSSSRGIPPRANCSIVNINLLKKFCIFTLVTKSFVLILEFQSNELLSVHVYGLSLMEKTSPLLVNHHHCGISKPINNANSIPICLHITQAMNFLKFGFVTPSDHHLFFSKLHQVATKLFFTLNRTIWHFLFIGAILFFFVFNVICLIIFIGFLHFVFLFFILVMGLYT